MEADIVPAQVVTENEDDVGLARPDRNVHAADEFTTVEDLRGLSDAIAYFLAADSAPDGADQTDSFPTEGTPQ